MAVVCSVKEVEQQLKKAGELLALPPASTIQLLNRLDRVEHLLTSVGQAPCLSMQGALVPSMGALISDEILKHSDMDVKVSVASCLCEVARITAPDPPYKDEIMKEIFQLKVMAFEELSNETGRNYDKALHILASVAKVKSFLLMLDLECDDLILEMFEHFLSRIRANHPPTVVSDMESIMTLVLLESDEIATELLSLLISHVRTEFQDLSPVPWKLAEKVLKNCYETLKSYSQILTKLLKSDPNDYAEVVTAICQNPHGNELMVIKSTKNNNNTHKRDANALENGGSTKKQKCIEKKKYIDKQKFIEKQKYIEKQKFIEKQKHIETQRITPTILKKFDATPANLEERNKQWLKGKVLEASQNLDLSENLSTKTPSTNKSNDLNQENRPNSVTNSKEDSRRTRFQDKSKSMKSSKSKGNNNNNNNNNNKRSGDSLYNVVIKKEDEVQFNSVRSEPLSRSLNDKAPNRRKPSSASRGKDLKVLKKYGEELVGHRIKVWWPLDKKYYKGAVSSYDPVENKYKVLYADGDEEVLDLHNEKWSLINETPLDQERVADLPCLPSPMTTSDTNLKHKGKINTESSSVQVENSSSPNSPTPPDSSKTNPTKETEFKGTSHSSTEVQLCNVVGLGSTETTIDKVEQAFEINPSGEHENKTPTLENNEQLVCEKIN